MTRSSSLSLRGSLVALLLLTVAPARAQQPMQEFVEAARAGALDAQAAQAALDVARSQTDEARARLLPTLVASAAYTRNEIEVAVQLSPERRAVISPYDQLDARFTLSVPILDISSWSTFFAAEAAADAAEERTEATDDDVEAAVVQLWHQVVATRAVLTAAERSLEVAEQARANAAARVEVGVSPQLDLARAEAESARARQIVAEARLADRLASRNLAILTGLVPTAGAAALPEADLADPGELESWLAELERRPGVRAAERSRRSAELAADASWQTLLPVISGTGIERITNAAGFGPNSVWSLAITATWTLDFVRPATIGTRDAQLSSARIAEARALQLAATQIVEAWERVRSLIVRAEAAQAQLVATTRAAEDARVRYEAGAGTQIEVIQAERDLFSAEVARIQAHADLRVAREVLRIRSGRDGS